MSITPHGHMTRLAALAALLVLVMTSLLACGGGDDTLTIYSGRSQSLVGPRAPCWRRRRTHRRTWCSCRIPATWAACPGPGFWRNARKTCSPGLTRGSGPQWATGWGRRAAPAPSCTTLRPSIPGRTCRIRYWASPARSGGDGSDRRRSMRRFRRSSPPCA